jgi:WhiB family redox-sensing transcriptional regulator
MWLMVPAPGRWVEEALCAQTDPGVFHPAKDESAQPAKRICQLCGVRAECLEYALEHKIPFGVWGGLSQRERKARLRSGS